MKKPHILLALFLVLLAGEILGTFATALAAIAPPPPDTITQYPTPSYCERALRDNAGAGRQPLVYGRFLEHYWPIRLAREIYNAKPSQLPRGRVIVILSIFRPHLFRSLFPDFLATIGYTVPIYVSSVDAGTFFDNNHGGKTPRILPVKGHELPWLRLLFMKIAAMRLRIYS